MPASKLKKVALALGAALSSTPALAQDRHAVTDRSVAAVSYADLDLRTPTGIARLNRRVRQAAVRLCDSGINLYPVSYRERSLDCQAVALASAGRQIAQAVFSAIRFAARDPRRIMLADSR
jgi:UrcA family protein